MLLRSSCHVRSVTALRSPCCEGAQTATRRGSCGTKRQPIAADGLIGRPAPPARHVNEASWNLPAFPVPLLTPWEAELPIQPTES